MDNLEVRRAIASSLEASRLAKLQQKINGIAEAPLGANPEISTVLEKVENVDVKSDEIKMRTVRHLASVDKHDTGRLVGRLDLFSYRLDQLRNADLNSIDLSDIFHGFEDIDQSLFRFIQMRADSPVVSPIEDIQLAVQRGDRAFLELKLDQYKALSENPRVVWQDLVRQGIVTQDFVDNLFEVTMYVEMADKARIVEGLKGKVDEQTLRSVRVRVFKEYLAKNPRSLGISLDWLDEIAEGRFELDEHFVHGALEMFTKIWQPSDKKRNMSRDILIRSAALGMLGASVTASVPLEQISDNVVNPPPIVIEVPPEIDLDDVSQIGEETSSIENSPELDNPKDEWYLEGDDLIGYYKISTGSRMIRKNGKFQWVMDRFGGEGRFYETADISQRVKSHFDRLPTFLRIPKKDGYIIQPSSVNIKIGGKEIESDNYLLVLLNDGSYIFQFTGDTKPSGEAELDIGFAKNETVSNPPFYTNIYKDRIVDLNNLPANVRDKISEIKNSRASDLDKVRMLTEWVRNSFDYSQDSTYSDYYNNALSPEDFLNRIFEKKKTDCDVANTVLLLLVRELDINSRMAFGYINNGRFDGKSETLNQSEGHGWVEAFIDDKWETFDATPPKSFDFGMDFGFGLGDLSDWMKLLSSLEVSLGDIKIKPEDAIWPAYFTALGWGTYILLRVKKKDEALNRLAHRTAATIFKNYPRDVRADVNQVVEKTISKDRLFQGRGIVGNTKDIFQFVTLPFQPKFWQSYSHRIQMEKAARDISSVAARFSNSDTADPLRFMEEGLGLDPEKVNQEVVKNNTWDLVEQLSGQWMGALVRICGDENNPDWELRNALHKVFIGKYRYDANDAGLPDIFDILSGRDLDGVLEEYIKNAWIAYRAEEGKRMAARIRIKANPNLRNEGIRELAAKLPLDLTEQEFKQVLLEDGIGPLIVMWHMANTQNR